jgi:hypothetical protein
MSAMIEGIREGGAQIMGADLEAQGLLATYAE